MHVSGDLIETCLHFCNLGLAKLHNKLTISDLQKSARQIVSGF
jgi:hypothetical protein